MQSTNPTTNAISIYTDGSCDTRYRTGAWVAIIFFNQEKIVIDGLEQDTTHQRMELLAIIKSLKFVVDNNLTSHPITIYTDSQYVTKLPSRKNNLMATNYLTKNKSPLPNSDLLKTLFTYIEGLTLTFTKVIAHQKAGSETNYNIEADKLCRKIMRSLIRDSTKYG